MNRFGVNHFKAGSGSKFKASMVERVIRTLKTRLERFFKKNKTVRWIDVLDEFVADYNKTPHSKIGLAPNQVNEKTAMEVYNRLYPHKGIIISCKLDLGDKVRVLLEKNNFEKGYKQSWSDQIYIIVKKLQSNTVCWYRLADLRRGYIFLIFIFFQKKYIL